MADSNRLLLPDQTQPSPPIDLHVNYEQRAASRGRRGGAWRLGRLVHVGEAALAAGLAVLVAGHEDGSTAGGALATKTSDLSIPIHFEELENAQLIWVSMFSAC